MFEVFPTAIPVLSYSYFYIDLSPLIEKIKQFPTLGFGDIVKASHQNIIVDTLKLISNIIEMLEPHFSCPEFSKIVNKLRYVTKGDLILPEDHNFVVDALKELLICFKERVGESDMDIIALEYQINSLNYVKKGEPVLASVQNTKYKAISIASKLLSKIVKDILERQF